MSSCIAGQDQRSAVAIFLTCMRVRVCRPKLFKKFLSKSCFRRPPLLFKDYTPGLTAPFPELPGWAGTRKVKPNRILLDQEIVSGSGVSRAICNSAPRSRQITTPAPHHSVFYTPDALPAAQPTASKHCRPHIISYHIRNI